ncbi:hypothetical protein J3A73_004634 [Rhizobium sp. PvP099]|nr:hypothetical protein [Rhizobium sp. PvP099]
MQTKRGKRSFGLGNILHQKPLVTVVETAACQHSVHKLKDIGRLDNDLGRTSLHRSVSEAMVNRRIHTLCRHEGTSIEQIGRQSRVRQQSDQSLDLVGGKRAASNQSRVKRVT